MGFIATGNTFNLTAYLTQKGREMLLNGSEEDITAKYFALGDSDSNYNLEVELGEGFVPDLSGDNSDCVISLANNTGIKNPILYNKTIVPVVTKSQVMFQRPDNSSYYNVLDCLVHLDRLGRYQLFHSSNNQGNPDRLKLNNTLLSPFPDLYNEVAIVNKPSLLPSSNDFDKPSSLVFEMLFDPLIFKKINNTYIENTPTNTVNQTDGGKSPIAWTFSSKVNATDSIYGAGKSSVGIYNREIGYTYRAVDTNNWTFASADQTENIKNYTFYTDGNNTLLDKYTSFTLAAKIDSKDENNGLIKSFIYRGDQNLNNISEANMSTYSDELKFSNQYAKLFDNDKAIIDGIVSPVNIAGLMQKEISNLVDFVQTSGLFFKVQGTNEYRTSKLTFSVYPTDRSDIIPGTLNVIFSYNNDILLDVDPNTNSISTEGNTQFIQYDFNSTNGIFKNRAKSAAYVRNNCGTNSAGSSQTYSVPVGIYTGTTQAEADGKADNDIAQNGQNYANTNGTCSVATIYQSSVFSGYYTKNDCAVGYQGSNILVQFPAGQFTSQISQIDANSQAALAAQAQANAQGTCTYIPVKATATFNFDITEQPSPFADINVQIKNNGEVIKDIYSTEKGSFTITDTINISIEIYALTSFPSQGDNPTITASILKNKSVSYPTTTVSTPQNEIYYTDSSTTDVVYDITAYSSATPRSSNFTT